jgi:hypothetical protein
VFACGEEKESNMDDWRHSIPNDLTDNRLIGEVSSRHNLKVRQQDRPAAASLDWHLEVLA